MSHSADQNKMTLSIFDGLGKSQTLDQRLARGGEGEIYPLLHKPDILVKCYYDHVLEKNQRTLQAKVQAMHSLRHALQGRPFSWPAISVFDQNKAWKGYAMPRVQGHTLRVLAHALAYKKYAPTLNRLDIVKVLISLLDNVEYLHQQGIMIGDYNLSNFMWNSADFSVSFIDCDSYQIQIGQQCYPCLVGSPDLTAPEHHGKPFQDIQRTPASEYFSVAIVLFMCLMLGRHPYDMVGGEDPVQNLRSGKFAYGQGNHGIPKGNWYNIWSHMPYRLKSLFIQTFTEGTHNPSKRATTSEWINALKIYQKEMLKGYHHTEIIPAQPKLSK